VPELVTVNLSRMKAAIEQDVDLRSASSVHYVANLECLHWLGLGSYTLIEQLVETRLMRRVRWIDLDRNDSSNTTRGGELSNAEFRERGSVLPATIW
jgi:hypothetical protein